MAMVRMSLLIILLVTLAPSRAADIFSHPKLILPTTGQDVKGKYVENAAVFHGVPYATPPLGDLRFAPPQKLDVEVSYTQGGGRCPWRRWTSLRS